MSSQGPKRPNLDSVTTINQDGSRYFLHPADVKGRYTVLRRLTGWLLILIYAVLPWIKINGFPAVFIDIQEARFHFFRLTLVPQDMWVFFFLLTGLAFGLFVVSSLLGRVWCGWLCPYTVFLEHIFRRIERITEGDGQKRRLLAKAPWTGSKITKRVIKWSFYALAAAVIAHIFLSYFISLPQLWEHMKEGPAKHPGSFGFVFSFTAVFYFCFSWFREQFCIIMCPYGRLQSALTDDDTFNVMYDHKRGEPRGKAKKGSDQEFGSCVDCRRCVNVCPTGIDIRNGLQIECIGCSACIDACDDIMRKLKRPTGLIRYDSANGIEKGKRRILRPRILAYAALALLGLTALSVTANVKAKPFHAEVHRFPGAPYQADARGVRNHYKISITNKRNQEMSYSIELTASPELKLNTGAQSISIPALQDTEFTLVVDTDIDSYQGTKELLFKVISSAGNEVELEARFLGPNTRLYKESHNKLETP